MHLRTIRADKVYLNVFTCLKCLESNTVTLWRYVIVMHCLFLTYTFHIASFWHRKIIDSTLCRNTWHGGCWTQNECVLIHSFDLTFIFRKRPWRNMGTHNTFFELKWAHVAAQLMICSADASETGGRCK